jgi:hypothetical protein
MPLGTPIPDIAFCHRPEVISCSMISINYKEVKLSGVGNVIINGKRFRPAAWDNNFRAFKVSLIIVMFFNDL